MKPIGLGGWSLNTHRPHPEEARRAVSKVEVVEAAAAKAGSHRAPTYLDASDHHGCDPLHSCDRLPMACFAERLSAVLDGSALLLRLARPQRLAADQSCPGRAHAPGGGTQALSLGWYYRQPERENDGKWRSMRV